jgi:MSHA pilin protein MshD
VRRGFVLIEVTIAYVLLAVALTALVPVFIVSVRAGTRTEQLQTATYLAAELLEEVKLRKWDEVSTSPGAHVDAPSTLGIDTGETATDKTTFDDLDDFNGYSEPAATDPLNRALTDFKDFSRSVTVSYVDSDLNASVATTNYKQITACAKTAKTANSCLTTLVTNH